MSLQLWKSEGENIRKFRSFRGNIIILEGLIGVGKTTLGYSLEAYLNQIGLSAKFFPEFKNVGLLKQYINDMKRYAYTFQIAMLMARLEIYRQADAFAKTGGISIIDRSLPGDYTFAKMQKEQHRFTNDEWLVYKRLIPLNLSEPNCIVMLNCDPIVAFERMKTRGEKSEISGYTLEYFQQLNTYYQQTFNDISHPIIIIDWNKSRQCIVDGSNVNRFLDIETCQYVLNAIWKKLYL